MFLDCTIWADEAAEDARRILSEWEEEHAGYYGTPAGAWHGAGWADIPGGGLWLTSGKNYHALQIVSADADLWSMSANGVTEGVRVTYCGRRHGMRHEFAAFLKKYWRKRFPVGHGPVVEVHAYITQEPDWLPWETLDDHRENVGVRAN